MYPSGTPSTWYLRINACTSSRRVTEVLLNRAHSKVRGASERKLQDSCCRIKVHDDIAGLTIEHRIPELWEKTGLRQRLA